MPFFLIFIIIPLMELYIFAKVGARIGAVNTLILCLLAAGTGILILRRYGLPLLLSPRKMPGYGQAPVKGLFDGLCVSLAALFLIIPGFLSDVLGLMLLTPFLRDFLLYLLKHRFRRGLAKAESFSHGESFEVIETEFQRVEGGKEGEEKDGS